MFVSIAVDKVGKYVFKVMTYNVLSQHLLYEHLHLYSKHDQDALDWKRRRRLIFNEISDEQPDVSFCTINLMFFIYHVTIN